MVKAVVCCGKSPSNTETVPRRCSMRTHLTLLCWMRLSSVCVCLSLFVMQEMEERIQHFETFLWDGQKTCQVDPVQLGTTKTHKLKAWRSLGVQPSTQNPHAEKDPSAGREHDTDGAADRDIQWCYRLRNLARTKPLMVCQSHRRTHTTGDGRPWCYSGAYFYPCCSWDYFLTRMTSKTNRSGDVISQPGRLRRPEQAGPTRSQHTWESMHYYKHTHTHTQILTSRSVNAECR